MPEAADILARIDAIALALAELRAEVAADVPTADTDRYLHNGHDPADDFDPINLIDVAAASARFNCPADTVRNLCRDQGVGIKTGGCWQVSAPLLARWLRR